MSQGPSATRSTHKTTRAIFNTAVSGEGPPAEGDSAEALPSEDPVREEVAEEGIDIFDEAVVAVVEEESQLVAQIDDDVRRSG